MIKDKSEFQGEGLDDTVVSMRADFYEQERIKMVSAAAHTMLLWLRGHCRCTKCLRSIKQY